MSDYQIWVEGFSNLSICYYFNRRLVLFRAAGDGCWSRCWSLSHQIHNCKSSNLENKNYKVNPFLSGQSTDLAVWQSVKYSTDKV